MSKYIIKNCPCFNNERFIKNYLEDGDNYCPYKETKCEDIADCVMKQIVNYCRDNEKYGDAYYTNPILELLDIQEIT